ncbi:MAG: FAD:protein FMN transferase [Thermoanaerobaculia bacterium]|nr:FAD:protein FMN transferase [Thermoanaerobaculia bacterium]
MKCFTASLALALGLVAELGAQNAPRSFFEARTPQGREVRIEILPGPATEAHLQAAFDHIVASESLLQETVATLNRGAGGDRVVPVEPAVVELLVRAQGFCLWSLGATSPLGGHVWDHWRAVAGAVPAPPPAPGAVASAGCDQLRIEGSSGTVAIAAGSRVDLTAFTRGFAVDRAVALLQARGVASGWVEIDRVRRAFGASPADRSKKPGWPVVLPQFEGFDGPLETVTLGDQALAIAWRRDEKAGIPLALDFRTGQLEEGTWATLVVTPLAVDAEAWAATALALGSREGRYRIATLRPEPSVLWLLGRGRGRPLLEELRWPWSEKRR